MFVFHCVTNDTAWSISLFQSAGVQRATLPEPAQKWPLKWVPISWPAVHACRRLSSVILMWSSLRYPMSEAPSGLFGGAYWSFLSSGSR